jgi:acyl dehydratase
MPLTPGILGLEFEPLTVEVTARMTLAFAAGIGDVGPRTFDDAAAVGCVAPPSFCAALEWPVLSRGRAHSLALTPDERLRAVHVEQDSVFHRSIHPGDRLRTGARIVAVRGTRAGAFVKTCVVTADARNGTPVVTSWHGSIYRGLAWVGSDAELEASPPSAVFAGPFDRGHSIATAPETAHVYTECSGIWNPIHTERRAALAAGLPGIILHGTATWALAGRELVRSYAQNEPTRLRRLRARFAAMVTPGETLTLQAGRSPECRRVHFIVANAENRLVLADGIAEFDDNSRASAKAS